MQLRDRVSGAADVKMKNRKTASVNTVHALAWSLMCAAWTPPTAAGAASAVVSPGIDGRHASGSPACDSAASAFAPDAEAAAVTIPAGCAFRVTGTTILRSPVAIEPGGTIIVDGALLTIAGPFTAPAVPVFQVAGGGAVKFSPAQEVRPEWWGSSNGDWLPALRAAAVSGGLDMPLLAHDYPISSTWKITTPFLHVHGVWSIRGAVAGQGTRILVQSATSDVIQVGLDAPPAHTTCCGDLPNAIQIDHLEATRSMPPKAGAQGSELSSPVGIRVQYALAPVIDHTASRDSSIGYYFGGVVYAKVSDNYAQRTVAGPTTAADFFWGYYLDGAVDEGLSGGNGSLYMERDNTAVEARLFQPVGLYANGNFADTFIRDFESSGTSTCMIVKGTWTAGATVTQLYRTGNQDLHIDHPVCDAFTNTGFLFQNINEYGGVTVSGGYAAPAPGAVAGVHFYEVHGGLSMTGVQLPMFPDRDRGGNAVGILSEHSDGIRSAGNMVSGAARPEVLIATSLSSFGDVLANDTGETAMQAALGVKGSSRNVLRPIIKGGLGVYPAASATCPVFCGGAIALDGGSTHDEVDATAVDPKTSATSIKLRHDGVAVTRAGPFGAGNVLLGVPD